MQRRALLVGGTLLATGCVGMRPDTLTDEPEPSTTPSDVSDGTPTPAAFPDIPKPDRACHAVTLPSGTYSYPPLPETLTEEAVTTFVGLFEETYAVARLNGSYSGLDGRSTTVKRRTTTAALVHVWLALDYTSGPSGAAGSATTLSGGSNSEAWYFLTTEYALRARGSGGSGGSVPDHGWETVACADEETLTTDATATRG